MRHGDHVMVNWWGRNEWDSWRLRLYSSSYCVAVSACSRSDSFCWLWGLQRNLWRRKKHLVLGSILISHSAAEFIDQPITVVTFNLTLWGNSQSSNFNHICPRYPSPKEREHFGLPPNQPTSLPQLISLFLLLQLESIPFAF